MNFRVFSTPSPNTSYRENVQNRGKACFSVFFTLAFLKCHWRKVADFSII
jgi:hypothetical protein